MMMNCYLPFEVLMVLKVVVVVVEEGNSYEIRDYSYLLVVQLLVEKEMMSSTLSLMTTNVEEVVVLP